MGQVYHCPIVASCVRENIKTTTLRLSGWYCHKKACYMWGEHMKYECWNIFCTKIHSKICCTFFNKFMVSFPWAFEFCTVDNEWRTMMWVFEDETMVRGWDLERRFDNSFVAVTTIFCHTVLWPHHCCTQLLQFVAPTLQFCTVFSQSIFSQFLLCHFRVTAREGLVEECEM